MNALIADNNELVISDQILREYAHVSIREARCNGKDVASATADAIQNMEIFRQDLTVLYSDEAAFNIWLKLLPTILTQKDVFDCNIVALMQVYSIRHIYVNDFGHFPNLVVIPLFP